MVGGLVRLFDGMWIIGLWFNKNPMCIQPFFQSIHLQSDCIIFFLKKSKFLPNTCLLKQKVTSRRFKQFSKKNWEKSIQANDNTTKNQPLEYALYIVTKSN